MIGQRGRRLKGNRMSGSRSRSVQEPKSEQVVLHITPAMRCRLQALADEAGLSLGRFCRDSLELVADELERGDGDE
jgi:hypothetical protein